MIRDIPGSPNWLPGQNPSVPPGVVVGIVVDASLTFGSETGTGLDSIIAGLKAAVVSAVNSAAGPSLAVSTVETVAAGASGIASVSSVTFNGDASITEVDAPTTTEAQYVSVTVRTIR